VALGGGVDRPLSAWEEMFLPLKLREHVRRVTVPGPDGRPRPLVRSERTIFESTAPPPPESPPSWVQWYLLLGVAIGGTALVLARSAREVRAARLGLMAVVAVWSPVAGLAGLVLAGLWGLTDHVMAYSNENLLQLNPLVLLVLPESPERCGDRGPPGWPPVRRWPWRGCRCWGWGSSWCLGSTR
jgi:hypothetical protein